MKNRTMPLRSVDLIKDDKTSESLVIAHDNNVAKRVAPARVSNDGHPEEKVEWWRNKNSQVQIFITEDKNLLAQYYAMRHQVYCIENGWHNYNSAENELDHKGKIIVAVEDGKVVGGMRLLTSLWVDYFPNEIPETEFTYRKFLKKYDLDDEAIISEISAFFVEKNHRDTTISTMLLDHAFKEARRYNCKYNVGISTPLLNRSHRREIKRLGYNVEIFTFPWKPQKAQNYVASCPIVIFLNELSTQNLTTQNQ